MNLIMKSAVTKLIGHCNRLIRDGFSERYLLYTNVGLSFTLSGVGDIIEQNFEILQGEQEQWDKIRTRNMSAFGMAIGVFCHYWYRYLDRTLPGYTMRIVTKKIFIDQVICSPICITTLFVTTSLLEGQSRDELIKDFKHKAWILYTAEWVVWPPAQFINFYFLPSRFRVLYDNTISLGYDIFTSHIKYKKIGDEDSS